MLRGHGKRSLNFARAVVRQTISRHYSFGCFATFGNTFPSFAGSVAPTSRANSLKRSLWGFSFFGGGFFLGIGLCRVDGIDQELEVVTTKWDHVRVLSEESRQAAE